MTFTPRIPGNSASPRSPPHLPPFDPQTGLLGLVGASVFLGLRGPRREGQQALKGHYASDTLPLFQDMGGREVPGHQ